MRFVKLKLVRAALVALVAGGCVFLCPVIVSASECPSLQRTLVPGMRGGDVRDLQHFLIREGHFPSGNATGFFGPLTASAVRAFQDAQNIVSSGTPTSTGYGAVGPATRQAIRMRCGDTLGQPWPITAIEPAPSGDSGPVLTVNLYRGIDHPQVAMLQRFLQRTDDFAQTESITYYGVATETAVKKFQCRVMRICAGTADSTGYGVVGPATRRAIREHRFIPPQAQAQQTNTAPPTPHAQVSPSPTPQPPQSTAAVYAQPGYYQQGSYAPAASCTPRTLSAASQALMAKFDVFDISFNNGWGYANNDNLAGILAHNESHWMDSYIVMFKATNDERYLKKAIAHADKVLSKRDNKIGVQNWRGESLGIWSRNDHSGTAAGPFPHLVELGLITAPIAEIAALIKTTACLRNGSLEDGRTYQSVADAYVSAVREVDAFNHADWHTDTKDGNLIGWYTTPLPESPWNSFFLPFGKPPPVNYVTAFGETLAHMYKATGDSSYYTRARAIGYWVVGELTQYDQENDAYWHLYWPQMTYYPAGYTDKTHTFPEDIGHFAYTAGFMEAMINYDMGVFDGIVMRRVAHSVSRLAFQPSRGGFVLFMNGTGDVLKSDSNAVHWAGFYLFLRPWDAGIVPAVEHALFRQKDISSATALGPEGMFSLAQYIWYKQ